MKAIRRTALIHIASVLVLVFGAVTLAAAPYSGHRSCAAKQHDCGKAARVAPACCGGQEQGAAQASPAQLREDPSTGSTVLYGFAKMVTIPAGPAGPSAIARAPGLHRPDPLSLFSALRL